MQQSDEAGDTWKRSCFRSLLSGHCPCHQAWVRHAQEQQLLDLRHNPLHLRPLWKPSILSESAPRHRLCPQKFMSGTPTQQHLEQRLSWLHLQQPPRCSQCLEACSLSSSSSSNCASARSTCGGFARAQALISMVCWRTPSLKPCRCMSAAAANAASTLPALACRQGSA